MSVLVQAERLFVRAATVRAQDSLGLRGVSLTEAGFVRVAALEQARRVLGVTLEQFQKRKQRPSR